ncbi:MAG TPA: 2-amino-4-hydroxy-6-hydroxymethyldihydropteridine diphosphokinase [Bacteroidales bacterium]|nr:2-amino-4-hydroxy-6-hydroxymethyldihydropteridine diphosphokinase [Bacteroidales bacterium]
MKKVILLCGGNKGNRAYYMESACKLIEQTIGKVIQSSAIYESAPWGFQAEQNFYNQVVVVETRLAPLAILKKIWGIEKTLGRIRVGNQYSSRTIDIDILFYEQEIIDTSELVVPHPQLHQRRFTLTPLAEILPDWIHPGFNQPIRVLLEQCTDLSSVKVVES